MVIRKAIASGSPSGQRAPADEVFQGFAAWLKERGYAPTTCRLRLMFVAGMMRWMEARRIPLAEFDERVISADLARRGHPTSKEVQRSLTHFLEYVRQRGHAPAAVQLEDSSAAARIERRYVRYLYRERGVGDSTVVNYSGLVRPLILSWFRRKRRADFAGFDARRVTHFLLSTAHSMTERRAQLLSCALRSFLRFLFLESETPVDLSLSVPSIRRASRSVSQRYLELDDIERIIPTCDVGTAQVAATAPFCCSSRGLAFVLVRLSSSSWVTFVGAMASSSFEARDRFTIAFPCRATSAGHRTARQRSDRA